MPTGDNRVTLRPKTRPVEALFGIFKTPGQKPLSIREMDEAIAEAAVERFLRATPKRPK